MDNSSKRIPTQIPLHTLFRDPVVASAFRRADRDNGSAASVSAPRDPSLIGSAGASLKWRMQLEMGRA